ncbi:MAG: GxxExxY protein [Proteobacteria bacterium]|nr:GxxExxY protein [Pseudomonadota bacterium]
MATLESISERLQCKKRWQGVHKAQLLTYLKLTNIKLGFLLNWNVPLMKDGIKRMVNNLKQQ